MSHSCTSPCRLRSAYWPSEGCAHLGGLPGAAPRRERRASRAGLIRPRPGGGCRSALARAVELPREPWSEMALHGNPRSRIGPGATNSRSFPQNCAHQRHDLDQQADGGADDGHDQNDARSSCAHHGRFAACWPGAGPLMLTQPPGPMVTEPAFRPGRLRMRPLSPLLVVLPMRPRSFIPKPPIRRLGLLC